MKTGALIMTVSSTALLGWMVAPHGTGVHASDSSFRGTTTSDNTTVAARRLGDPQAVVDIYNTINLLDDCIAHSMRPNYRLYQEERIARESNLQVQERH